MTLPPHGPPEITEAQQAATSLGEVEDPTPDNVSRALQDYSPYAVAAAAAALGASGGGGGGSQPFGAVQLRTSLDFADPKATVPIIAPAFVSGGLVTITMPPSPFGDNGVVKVRVFNDNDTLFYAGGSLVVCKVDGLVYLAQDADAQTVPAADFLDMAFSVPNVSAGVGLSWSEENLQIDIASAGVFSAYAAIYAYPLPEG